MQQFKFRSKLVIAFLAMTTTLINSPAHSQKVGPYDVRYKTTAPTAVLQSIDPGSPVITTIPKGKNNIVLRWCRPEFPFGNFMFGNLQIKRQLLAERMCEANHEGATIFIHGKTLTPDL